MTLTIDQQKNLYNGLYDHIIDLHTMEYKSQLKNFTQYAREKGWKGIVLLDYTNIKDMIQAVKNKDFGYQWIPEREARKIKHGGIPHALLTMKPHSDCVLVCSLSLSEKHLYVNCIKITNI
ncbi:putative orfan [Tupanvirus soda lake]|uniref:Orfan n=2 Tax=Tupanvirus TaxID=2094720 RepID=A0AC62ABV1_9VIRU|nr:putative orfan [Tupanvirus soda lake]QKU35272.1 putative orfan [Tupanvirus soda lake]